MLSPSQDRHNVRRQVSAAWLIPCLVVTAVLSFSLPAGESPDLSTRQVQASSTIVARVNGQPIRRGEVLDELDRRVPETTADSGDVTTLRATVLEYLVRRSVVLQTLSRKGLGASQQDVDFQLEQERRRLANQNVQLADYLRQHGLDVEALRRRFAWQLGWPRFLERYLGEEYLKKQFDSRPRDYDGTQIRVAHILLRVPRSDGQRGDQSAWDRRRQRAEEIRRRISSGEITFADAAREYSEAPTADQGGDLEFISRHEPMPESFSRAAFSLQPAETSGPVVTSFGVHLIHCLQVKPGQRRWQDVRDRLRKDLARRVFDNLVQRERRRARVEYTGAMPYIDPESGKLVDVK